MIHGNGNFHGDCSSYQVHGSEVHGSTDKKFKGSMVQRFNGWKNMKITVNQS
jgi:hypothetical protein